VSRGCAPTSVRHDPRVLARVVLGLFLLATVAHAQPSPDEGDVPPETMPSPPAPLAVRLPIRFRVARDAAGDLVRDKRWLVAQTERASTLFAPAGITFVIASVEPLDAADLETRDDRHGLARHLERGVINAFVVRAMRDVDDPTQWRRGVHWRLPWRRERHFVIVTEIAPPITLAHELGHFFGNPKHRWVPGNVMSYEAGDAPTFDPDQLHRIVAHARRYLRSGELVTHERLGELTARGELPRRWDGVEPP
jgi:hypothetical protein